MYDCGINRIYNNLRILSQSHSITIAFYYNRILLQIAQQTAKNHGEHNGKRESKQQPVDAITILHVEFELLEIICDKIHIHINSFA